MSRYIVEIVGPSNYRSYLSNGREVRRENATRYYHPSAAQRAGRTYAERAKLPADTSWRVVDTRIA